MRDGKRETERGPPKVTPKPGGRRGHNREKELLPQLEDFHRAGCRKGSEEKKGGR